MADISLGVVDAFDAGVSRNGHGPSPALYETRTLDSVRPTDPAPQYEQDAQNEQYGRIRSVNGGDGSAHDVEGAAEPHWQVLAREPALVDSLTRTGAETARAPRADLPNHPAESRAAPVLSTRHVDAEYADSVVAGHDGLMDSWPGDMSRGGRWWWHARQYMGRLLADLRQGRLRWPQSIEPRIALGLVLALGVVVVVTAFGTLIVTHLLGTVTLPNLGTLPAAQPTTGIVLQTNPGAGAPTVAVAPYTMAAWVSNSAPPSFGTVQVYVRVTNSGTFAAQPGVSVGLSVAFTCATPGNVQGYGPTTTDANGMATFTVTFTNLPVGQPVCVTARATIGGQSYAATTTFAASGGIAVPTATPENPQPTPTPKKHKG